MAPRKWKQYRPDETPDPDGAPAQPPTHQSYRQPKQAKPVRSLEERTVRNRGFHPTGLLITGAALVLTLGAAAAFAIAGSEDAPAADRPQSDKGFDALVAALKEERGSTLVRNAIIYPDYAVVDVPYKLDDLTDEREISYYWNGELSESTKGTGDEETFDLADVDSSVLDGLCVQVKALVEDPTDCSIYISKPSPEDTTPEWIRASTSNEFNQSASIEFALDGTVIEVRPPS
ncbi:hypothetical protein [Nocardioides daeguensis]|uniref:Uncharacterized protein n=1 Tax=Nocardioides daeguensis TaxID=908359 RepID=A0ABP6W3C7_9ACTN|nr:hypothetical protein [Nocardioides daeguensis]MBV6726637.1 hypothetical protein [Nocardioides daeguensis]MCR1774611.1 hypothetical protein [Nocardioides daeguensis]